MDNLRLGDLIIQAGETGLSIRNSQSLTIPSEISLEDIPVLLDFMKSFLEESANRRSSFRLDLTELSLDDYQKLEVCVLTGRGQCRVRPLDISLTGMLLDAETYCGTEGEKVRVNIEFGSLRSVLSARVVRANESSRRIALQFPEVRVADGSVDAPEELTDIFHALEASWLGKSLGLDWYAA